MCILCKCLPCCGAVEHGSESEAAEQLLQNPVEGAEDERQRNQFTNRNVLMNDDIGRIDREAYNNDIPGTSKQQSVERLDFVELLDKLKELQDEVKRISNFLSVPATTNAAKTFNEEDEVNDDLRNDATRIREQVQINKEEVQEFEPLAQRIIDYLREEMEPNEETEQFVETVTNVFHIQGCNVNIGTMDGSDVQVTREENAEVPRMDANEREQFMRQTLQQLNISTESNIENVEIARRIGNHVEQQSSLEGSEEMYLRMVGVFDIESQYAEETYIKEAYSDAALQIRRVMEIHPPAFTKENPKRKSLETKEFLEACEELKNIPGIKPEAEEVLDQLKKLGESQKPDTQRDEMELKYKEIKEKVKEQEAMLKQKEDELQMEKQNQRNEAQTINDVIVEKVQESIRKELKTKMKEQQEQTFLTIEDLRSKLLTEIMEQTHESIEKQRDFFVEEQSKAFASMNNNMNEITTDIQDTKTLIDSTTKKISESVTEMKNEMEPLLENTKKEIALSAESQRDLQTKQLSEQLTTLHGDIVKETETKIKSFQQSLMNSIPGLINAASSSGESQYIFEKALEGEFPKLEDDEIKKIQPDVINYLSRLTRSRGNLPPSSTELEVSLQSIFCEVKLNQFDLSDEMVKLKNTLKDIETLKPNEAQCERFTRLIPQGIIVGLEIKKPMKKEDAVDAWVLWGMFCDSLSHIPSTKGMKLVDVIDKVTEFATILHKDENESLDGKLITKCVESSQDFCHRLQLLYEEHKDSYNIVDNYLVGLIRLAKCMLFVKKVVESSEYTKMMTEVVNDSAVLNDDMKKDWSNRIQRINDDIAKS